MKRSVFITGASGYIGTQLLQQDSFNKYERLYCLTRKKASEPSKSYMQSVSGDLLDLPAYRDCLACCDTVLHLAAVTGKQHRSAYFRINTDGTRTLVDASVKAGVRRFIHISTIAAKFTDKSAYYYAQSKERAEEIVAHSGLNYAIIRPTMVIGPGAPVLEGLAKLAALPIVPIFGDGQTRIQPVFVGDLVQRIAGLLDSDNLGNQILEIGGPQIISIEEMLGKICRARFGRAPRVMHLPAKPVVRLLAVLEKFLLPWMPLTAGQLASFANDGTAEQCGAEASRQAKMQNIDEMLGLAFSRQVRG